MSVRNNYLVVIVKVPVSESSLCDFYANGSSCILKDFNKFFSKRKHKLEVFKSLLEGLPRAFFQTVKIQTSVFEVFLQESGGSHGCPTPSRFLRCAGVAGAARGREGSSGASPELPGAEAVGLLAMCRGRLRSQRWSPTMNLPRYVFVQLVENGDPSLQGCLSGKAVQSWETWAV